MAFRVAYGGRASSARGRGVRAERFVRKNFNFHQTQNRIEKATVIRVIECRVRQKCIKDKVDYLMTL
jgi:hypothetical protein